jgi:hypothetical protein
MVAELWNGRNLDRKVNIDERFMPMSYYVALPKRPCLTIKDFMRVPLDAPKMEFRFSHISDNGTAIYRA